MTLQEMIYQRKSCRSYTGKPVDQSVIERILSFEPKPLYPEIKVRMDILGRNQIRCIFPWTTPQVIAVYSEEKEGYLENVGFMFQQMDLYLQSLGLGVCWLGMGRMDPKAAAPEEFKRKRLSQIGDREDPRLEPARLAPSSINSQPWYFAHEGDALYAYCTKKGVVGYMNRIDMGIALAHLYVANSDTFRFFRAENPPKLSRYAYVGSVTL